MSNVEIKNKDILDTLDKYLDFYYNRDKYISNWFKTTRSILLMRSLDKR